MDLVKSVLMLLSISMASKPAPYISETGLLLKSLFLMLILFNPSINADTSSVKLGFMSDKIEPC